MTASYRWTGSFRRDPATGGFVGRLTDSFGFTIELSGPGVSVEGAYTLVGTPGEVPDVWKVPFIDDEVPP